MLATLAVFAFLATVQSASIGSGLSREINLNSIPGGDNDESNMIEPSGFASITDFLASKQGLGKKTDDASRMKALVKALYALDALDKKMAESSDNSDLNIEDSEDSKTEATADSTTTAAPATGKPATTTVGTTASTTPATEAAVPTTDLPATDSPTLVHDSEVNEFVEQIAKHISVFFQGILGYFDNKPNLPADGTVIIEIDEVDKVDGVKLKEKDTVAEGADNSESNESDSDSDSSEEVSTEDVPQWLVQMFESVAALPTANLNKGKEFRPREPVDAEERR